MDKITEDVVRALKAKLWIIALQGALALPDICAALESADGETTGARYREWFNKHLGPSYPYLPAAECWKMRCSMLHQGRTATISAPGRARRI